MIGDIFHFSNEGYAMLAEHCENSYLFYTVETDQWPRAFHVARTEKLITAPLYSIFGCFHNEVLPSELERGQIIYHLNRAKIRPYRFEARSNPDGRRKIKAKRQDGINDYSYLDQWSIIAFSHAFEEIKDTDVKRCKRCQALLTREYKPRNKVSLPKPNNNELSL